MQHLAWLVAALSLPAQEPDEVKAGGKGVRMDYGPFLTSTVSRVKYKSDADLLAYKAISIKVAPDATFCFDPDLLRMAGAWTGGFLDYSNTHLVSYKGSLPTTMRGTLRNAPKGAPAFGPLPPERGRWNGLYLHGNKVVLSYTLEGCPVLDLPGYEGGA